MISPPGHHSSQPKISADGKVVAFAQNYNGGLTIVRPDGSGFEVLGPDPVGQISLSRNARFLTYGVGYAGVFVLDTSSRALVEVSGSADGLMAVISEDGSKIAFWDDLFRIWTVDRDGSNLLNISGWSIQGDQGGPSITADGSFIAFEANSFEGAGIYYDIHTIRSDGTNLTRLTFDPNTIYLRARVSGDGSKIAFGLHTAGLFSMDADGSNVISLTPGLVLNFSGETFDYHDINHDGSIAVFSTSLIGVVRTDGTGLRQIDMARGTVDISGRGDVIVYSQLIGADRRIVASGVPGVSPGDLMDVELSDDGQTLSWATRPSANSHNIYRASWSSPGAVSPGASGDCLQGGIFGSSASVSEDPPPAEAYGYYVTGENGWGEGTGGTTAQGTERVPATSCPAVDSDGDGVIDAVDVCPLAADPGQENPDGDALGSACDNCPLVANDDQLDFDRDGIGNACEP